MADTPKHSVSVAGIVVDDQDRVLVIQRRDNGHWEPPGGVLELNESPEQGVVREVIEETGIAVRVDHLSGVYKNMSRGIVSLVFRCTPAIVDHSKATAESRRVEWHSLVEVRKEMAPAYSVRVLDAFESDVVVRVHDGQNLLEGELGTSEYESAGY